VTQLSITHEGCVFPVCETAASERQGCFIGQATADTDTGDQRAYPKVGAAARCVHYSRPIWLRPLARLTTAGLSGRKSIGDKFKPRSLFAYLPQLSRMSVTFEDLLAFAQILLIPIRSHETSEIRPQSWSLTNYVQRCCAVLHVCILISQYNEAGRGRRLAP
jgi:hypothetical protein